MGVGSPNPSRIKHGSVFLASVLCSEASRQRGILSSDGASILFLPLPAVRLRVLAGVWAPRKLQSMPLSWLPRSLLVLCSYLFLAPLSFSRALLPFFCSESPYMAILLSPGLSIFLPLLFLPGLDMVARFWKTGFLSDLEIFRILLL